MDIMMIVLLVFTGIIVQQGGSELQEVPALEILNLSGQRSQVGRIIDSTVDFFNQGDGDGQQQVKGDVKEVMERLLPPRPSSSNSCEREKRFRMERYSFPLIALLIFSSAQPSGVR